MMMLEDPDAVLARQLAPDLERARGSQAGERAAYGPGATLDST